MFPCIVSHARMDFEMAPIKVLIDCWCLKSAKLKICASSIILIAVKHGWIVLRLFTNSTYSTMPSQTLCFVTQRVKLFPLDSMVATWVASRLQTDCWYGLWVAWRAEIARPKHLCFTAGTDKQREHRCVISARKYPLSTETSLHRQPLTNRELLLQIFQTWRFTCLLAVLWSMQDQGNTFVGLCFL